MMGFLEWVNHEKKRKEKELKRVGSNSQTGYQVRDTDNERKTSGFDQEIPTPIIHHFPEPR